MDSKLNEDDDDGPIEEKEKTFIAVSKDPHSKIYSEKIEKFTKTTGGIGDGTLSIETSNDPAKKFAFLVF